MFPYSSPRDTYEEYQERVARATHRHQLMLKARLASPPSLSIQARFGAWLDSMRRRLERSIQPAEEGYIA
jgi:hypothetical protein